jgi:PleD family two-component response regulator
MAWINPERLLPLDALINCADQALYSAKRQGRNSVVAWTQDEQSQEMGENGKPA